ncbi:MAG: hypothetical protein ACOH2T_27240 [Pseudomonas sp.]
MNDVKQMVETILCKLVGQSLVGAARAADMLTLQLGELRQRQTPLGRTVETGEWALHIQCAWRIGNAQGIYTGRSDYWQPPEAVESDAVIESWNPELGNLRDSRMSAWIAQRQTSPAKVQSVSSDCFAGIRLHFDDGYTLEVFSDSSSDEDWRLIAWDGDEHLVVIGGKPEW